MSRPLYLLGFDALFAVTSFAFETGGSNDITAVSGRTSKDYIRTWLVSGLLAPETYAFGKGGNWAGQKVDSSIDKLTFLNVAHLIANPLAGQNYIPSTDPKTTKLLIMVYWGTTHASEHASDSPNYQNLQIALSDPLMTYAIGAYTAAVEAENKLRIQNDYSNARMLGYDSWWEATTGDVRGTALESHRNDLLDELEDDRYFVVLMAYDFQLLWKEKKHRLLWETRFSIRQRHHDFDKDLPSMAQYASQFFGQDSHGLARKEVPLGHVEIGEVKSLGEVSEKNNN